MALVRYKLVRMAELPESELPQWNAPAQVAREAREKENVPTLKLKSVSPKQPKKTWRNILLRVVVTIALFALLTRSVSWSALLQTLGHLHYAYLLLGLSAGVVCVLFSSYGWHTLVLAERIRTDLARLINLYLVGMAFSHFLPTSMGGDAVKAFYVGSESGNMAGSTSAVLMSRITSFMGMLLVALPALAILHADFTSTIVVWFLLLSALLIFAMASSIVLAALLPTLSAKFVYSRWTQSRIFKAVIKVGAALYAASKRPGSLFAAMVYGILFWFASFLNYYGYAAALNVHVPLSFYIIAIPFVSIIAALPISINGFGVREGAFVYIFSTIHVSSATALLLALLMDAQVLFFGMLGGCIYLIMGLKMPKSEVKNG